MGVIGYVPGPSGSWMNKGIRDQGSCGWASMKLHEEMRGDVAAIMEPTNLCRERM